LICSFGTEEYRHLNRSSIFRCSGAGGSGGGAELFTVQPTMSTSFLCSLAADFALVQWTRYVLGLGQPVEDSLLQYCGFTHHTSQGKLSANANCACHHLILERIALAKPLGDFSCRELLQQAGLEPAQFESSALTIGDLHYVSSAICACGEQPVDRFLGTDARLGTCSDCQHRVTPQPFYTSRPTPFGDLAAHQERPLCELGVEQAAWAVVQTGSRGVLLHDGGAGVEPPSSKQEMKVET
jgi:hypothetical protein